MGAVGQDLGAIVRRLDRDVFGINVLVPCEFLNPRRDLCGSAFSRVGLYPHHLEQDLAVHNDRRSLQIGRQCRDCFRLLVC